MVPPEELEASTMKLAAKLANKSPLALQIGKTGIYGMSDLPYHQSIDYLGELFAGLCATEDAREGVTAFVEKRKPVWKGKIIGYKSRRSVNVDSCLLTSRGEEILF